MLLVIVSGCSNHRRQFSSNTLVVCQPTALPPWSPLSLSTSSSSSLSLSVFAFSYSPFHLLRLYAASDLKDGCEQRHRLPTKDETTSWRGNEYQTPIFSLTCISRAAVQSQGCPPFQFSTNVFDSSSSSSSVVVVWMCGAAAVPRWEKTKCSLFPPPSIAVVTSFLAGTHNLHIITCTHCCTHTTVNRFSSWKPL